MSLIGGRYPIGYRSALVSELMAVFQHGDSACLVGLAGTGKSNLARFLEDRQVARHYLPGSEADRIHFRRMECSAESTPDEIYTHMAQHVQQLLHGLGHAPSKPEVPGETPLFRLSGLLKQLCTQEGQRLVFIFDEFERLAHHQQPPFLQGLRSLRDDHRTSRNLAYLLVTHRMPQLITTQPALGKRGKLFELVREHLYALPPYSETDTQSMIDALVRQRNHKPAQLSQEARALLVNLSGGHSGLLAALFNEFYPDFTRSVQRMLHSAEQPSAIHRASDHIWHHLHAEEQQALQDLVHARPVPNEMVTFLSRRGLVTVKSTPTIFSPLLKEYIRSV